MAGSFFALEPDSETKSQRTGQHGSAQGDEQGMTDSGASHELWAGAARLASSAMRMYRLRAGLLWLSVCLLASLLLVTADYWIHAEEAGLRWLMSGLWLMVVVLAAWRLVQPAWTFTLAPVAVARWIERKRPDLDGRLSNSLAISELPNNDLRFGSSQFQRAALESLSKTPLNINWREYLDPKPTLWAAACFLLLSMTAAALAFGFPTVARRGAQRLFNPWSVAPWPRADELEFVALPEMIASGRELQIEVVDRLPPLPSDLELQVLSNESGSDTATETLTRIPMRVLNHLAIATLSEMRSPFSVRVVGGDHQDSSWHHIEVAELPELSEHQFHVVPPEYSHQPETDLVGERIEVLAGSRVTFRGRYTGRLRTLVALAEPITQSKDQTEASSTTAATTEETEWHAVLGSDRQAFELFAESQGGLVVDSDRRWRLQMETQEGLVQTDSRTWTIHVVPDRAPTINLAPFEPPWATRESTVNVFGDAADDLELVEIKMFWQVGEETEAHSRTLWTGKANTQKSTSADASPPEQTPAEPATDVSRSATVRYRLRPADEDSLPIGRPISVYLEARDSLGQTTRSTTQTLEIQDPQAVLAQIQAEEAKTFEPLRQLADAQHRNEQAVVRTRDILQETKSVQQEQLDAISTARQLEHSIAQQLAQSQTSVLSRLRSLTEQLERNGLARTEAAKRIANLANSLQRLSDEAITPAVEDLDEAQRMLKAAIDRTNLPANEIAALTQQVEKAAARQDSAVDEMRQMIDSIATAETTAELQQEFSELLARQNSVRAETERLQVERLLQPNAQTNKATQVGLRSDQQSLARAVEDLATTIGKQLQSDNLAKDNPAAHQALERARRALLDQRVSEQMRDAAELVDSGRLTEGITAQRDAAEALEKAAGKFGEFNSHDLESSAANMQEVAGRLGQLAQTESRLAQQLQEAANNDSVREGLTEEQSELASQAAQLTSDLQRRSDAQLSEMVKQAQAHAADAARQAKDNDFAQASEAAGQAAEQLSRAEAAASERAAQLDKQIAAQRLLDLGTAISELVRRQTPIVDNLHQLKQSRPAGTDRPSDWSGQLREVAAKQASVKQQLLDVASKTKSIEPFSWLLAQCETEMTRTVAALERQRLDPEALASADSALRKLIAAEQALTDSKDSEPVEPQDPSKDPANSESTDPKAQERRPTMASLKLLRALQLDINERTEKHRAEKQGAEQTDSQRQIMQRLADEQQALAEQTEKIMQQLAK